MSGLTDQAATFSVSLGGKSIKDDRILSIQVEQELNLPAMFTVEIRIDDINSPGWQDVDLSSIKLGAPAEIKLGQDSPQSLLKGEITAVEPYFGDPSSMEVRGYDFMHRMRFGQKRKSYLKKKDSDIAKAMATKAKLTASTESSKVKHENLFQNGLSDYDFLLQRAARLGYAMWVEGKTFNFKKPTLTKSSGVTLAYRTVGKTALEFFQGSLTPAPLGEIVKVRDWDILKKKVVEGKGKKGDEESKMGGSKTGYLHSKPFGKSELTYTRLEAVDKMEAKSLAKAQHNNFLLESITGRGACLGNPKIVIGKALALKGLGGKFSGKYFITQTTHSFRPEDGYKTEFQVKKTAI